MQRVLRNATKILGFVCVLAFLPQVVGAQSADTTVTAGANYAAGGLKRAILGGHYRDLWVTPIRVPFLDLRGFAGGLTPLEAHTGSQTTSLRFDGADGRTYQFRSVFKTPAAGLQPALQGTLVADLLQDGASASHPVGTVVVALLLEAAGVLRPTVGLFVMPDDPSLGEFRADFRGRLGLLEERPDEERDDGRGGFGRALRVIGPDRLFERIDDGPRDQVDTRAFLTARLIDILIGDRDRHRDNFRWALLDESGPVRYWVPISRDHDEAFVKLDGFALKTARRYYPQLVTFRGTYDKTLNLNWHSREVDRRFLAGVERTVWDSTATWVQGRLSDDVIDEAVLELPDEMYGVGGAELAASLKARRDGLLDEVARYYRILADEVEIHATNAGEVAEITRVDDYTLEVVIREDEEGAQPYLVRRFDARETREVRVSMWGGRDRVVVRGDGDPSITIRVEGGQGRDQLIDSTAAGGVHFYDQGGQSTVVLASGSSIDRRTYPEWIGNDLDRYPPREWGSFNRFFPLLTAGPDFGALVGFTHVRTRYGFRKRPYAREQTIQLGLSVGEGTGRFRYELDLRREGSDSYVALEGGVSDIEVLRFHGFGNQTETDSSGSGTDFRVSLDEARFDPRLIVSLSRTVWLEVGPSLRYSRTRTEDGAAFFASIADTLRGAGNFGRLGVDGSVTVDTRNRPIAATSGVLFQVGGRVVPRVWDAEETYGRVSAEARAFLTAPSGRGPTLALRAGGVKTSITAPFQESAFLGGRDNLRGWSSERFAGDASLYGSAEVRLRLSSFKLLFPGDLGVFGFGDAGKVYVDGSSPGGFHVGYGGGLSLAFVDPAHTLTFGLGRSEERSAIYAGLGFGF